MRSRVLISILIISSILAACCNLHRDRNLDEKLKIKISSKIAEKQNILDKEKSEINLTFSIIRKK